MSKVILSFPFSGAVQRLFGEDYYGKNSSINNSDYSRTLWGKNNEKMTTLSLTLFTLYDEVIFSPVDTPLPLPRLPNDKSHYWGSNEYYNPDLGLRMPVPDSMRFTYLEQGEYNDWLLADPVISRILSRIPKHAKALIFSQVVGDIELSLRYGAEIISSDGRRMLMKRICEVDSQYNSAKKNIANFSEPLSHITELIIPDFAINNIDLLHRIKQDSDIRKYGRKVTSVLKSNPNMPKEFFWQLALDSNLKNSKNQSINRFSTLAGKICSVLGFTPIVGPLFSAFALGLGESERLTSLSKSSWIEFKPHLSMIKTRFELENELKTWKKMN